MSGHDLKSLFGLEYDLRGIAWYACKRACPYGDPPGFVAEECSLDCPGFESLMASWGKEPDVPCQAAP